MMELDVGHLNVSYISVLCAAVNTFPAKFWHKPGAPVEVAFLNKLKIGRRLT